MPDLDLDPIPPAPNPTPLPDVSGYVRWPEIVKILIASAMAGGFTVEGLALALSNLSSGFDGWYVGPAGDTVKLLTSSIVTILIGLIAARRIARAGEPPQNFKRIGDKNSDDRY